MAAAISGSARIDMNTIDSISRPGAVAAASRLASFKGALEPLLVSQSSRLTVSETSAQTFRFDSSWSDRSPLADASGVHPIHLPGLGSTSHRMTPPATSFPCRIITLGRETLSLEGDPDAICVAILCPNLNRLIQPTKSSPAAQFPAPLFQSHEHGLLREVERLNRLWKRTFARSTKPRSCPRTKNSSWPSKLAKAM